MAFPDGWARKCKITIPAAKIAGNNNNFPVLLTQDNFPTEMLDGGINSALNGGGDVRVTDDSAGLTRLALDIVTFVTGGTPEVELYIKAPAVNTGADKDVWCWYKKTGEVQPAVTAPFGRNAVWPDSAAVLHFNDDIVDSSGNTTPTSTATALTYVDGTHGRAAKFVSSLITVPIADPTVDATLIIRMRQPSGSKASNGGFKFGGGGGAGDNHVTWSDDKIYSDFGHSTRKASNALTEDQTIMTQLAIRVSIASASNVYQVFYDNSSKLSTTGPTALDFSASATGPARTIGNYTWEAEVEHFRIDTVLRSADWLTTEYNNQNDPATFASAGTPEAVGGGGTETLVPDGLLTTTNLTGGLSAIDTDDTTWLVATDNNVDSIVIVSFPTPTGPPNTGVGLQNFTLKYRVTANGSSVTFNAYLRENGTRINGGAAIDTWTSGSTAEVTREIPWDAALLGTADGSLVELEIEAIKSGGSPTARTAGEFQFIDWDVVFTAAEAALIIQDAAHTLVLDNVSASQTHTVDIDDAANIHMADVITLSQTHILTPTNSGHTHNTDSLTLSQTHSITIMGTRHGVTSGQTVLAHIQTLVVANNQHDHIVDQVDLTQESSLSTDGSSHNVSSDNITLLLSSILLPNSNRHIHKTSTIDLSQIIIVAVDDIRHVLASETSVLSQIQVLSISDTTHSHITNTSVIAQEQVLMLASAAHTLVSSIPIVVQVITLPINDVLHNTASNTVNLLEFETIPVLSNKDNTITIDIANRTVLLDQVNRVIIINNKNRVLDLR